VSCVSAVSIYDALVEADHQVVPVGIDRAGGWHIADPGYRPFHASGRSVRLAVPDGILISGDDEIAFDVVFPVLHGPFGEDGTVQGLLELIGRPYVGNGVLASAAAMDKDIAKRLVADRGIPTTPYRVLHRHDLDADPAGTAAQLLDALGLPVFVKPAALGSSVGITKVDAVEDLEKALAVAFGFGGKVLVEEAIDGREIEVAVLEGGRVAGPGEVITASGWYDYNAKYHDPSSRFETPANLPDQRAEEVRALAVAAFEALEGRGLARVDFLYEAPGRGFLFNEMNTMPGFTPISGFPKMWEAAGMSYPGLCNELVELALGRGRSA